MKTHAPAPAKKNHIPAIAAPEPTGQFAPHPFPKPAPATNPPTVQARAQSPENLGQLINIPLLSPQQQAAGGMQPVQAKLTIGQPGDKYEQEADQMAAKVMRMPEPSGRVEGWKGGRVEATQPQLQREALKEEEKDIARKPLVQRETMPEKKEELAQAKFQVQRQAIPKEEQDKTLQVKPQLQREAMPEEEDEDTPDLSTKPQLQREEIKEDDKDTLHTKPVKTQDFASPSVETDEENLTRKPLVQRATTPDEDKEDETAQLKPLVQRATPAKEDEEETQPTLQAKDGAPQAPANFDNQLAQHKGGGQPLSDDTRAFMEPRFGADFSRVRVHETPDLANAIQAQAFTHGQDIYFNSGKYNPRSSGGKELLAHELTHVVQQRSGTVHRQVAPKSNNPNFWEWYGSGESNGGQAYLALRTELERRSFRFLTRIAVGNETDGSFLWKKGFPDRNTCASEVAWSIKLTSGNWSWATVKNVVPKCQRWLSQELMQELANGRLAIVNQLNAAESDLDRRTQMERLHSYDAPILSRLRRLTNNLTDRWHHTDPKVQDAVLAALQLDAVFNAEADLDLPTAEAHTAAYQDAQMASTHDWCGFFAARQYVRSNLDRDLRKGLFHVNNVEDYFNYSYERSNRIKKWIYVENSWKEVENYHQSRGSNRKWLNHQEVQASGLDIRSGDIVVLDHQGDGTGDHIVMAHSWDPLTNTLITIGGNDSGYQVVPNSSQSNSNTVNNQQDTERQRLEDSTGRSLRPGSNGGHVGVRTVRPEVRVHGIGRPSIIDFEDHIYSQRNSLNAPTNSPV